MQQKCSISSISNLLGIPYFVYLLLIIQSNLFCLKIHSLCYSSGKNLKLFSYDELRAATKNFHASNKIGQGGFGTVCKVWIIMFTFLARSGKWWHTKKACVYFIRRNPWLLFRSSLAFLSHVFQQVNYWEWLL